MGLRLTFPGETEPTRLAVDARRLRTLLALFRDTNGLEEEPEGEAPGMLEWIKLAKVLELPPERLVEERGDLARREGS